MAEKPQTPKKKGKSKKKRKFFSLPTALMGLVFLTAIAIVSGMIVYLLIFINGNKILAENGDKLEYTEGSTVYDSKGNELTKLYKHNSNREVAEASEIPKQMLEAIVAVEDQRFYEHAGLDFWAIGRALVKDIIARKAVEGASTITQQLAKNVFLNADKTFFRKATEASIAVALEQEMAKDDILVMYLNRIYFGKNVYGIKDAAKYYFDRDVSELELWQMATLAAIPKAPNRFNPINHPNDSTQRRSVVLQLMFEQGYITEAERDKAKAVVYEIPQATKQSSHTASAFIDYVVDEAMEITGLKEEQIRTGGFEIHTTYDAQAQQAMDKQFANNDNFEASVDEQLSQAAMVIMDHRTGGIVAMAGGRDYVTKGLNRVTQPRQPGSTIKPITVYGPALETGNYFPWTELDLDKKCFGDYCPRDKWGATKVTMKQAMKDSRNLAAVWTLNEIGVKRGFEFGKMLGLPLLDEDRNLSMALGGLTVGASPLQMASAYSVFARGGLSVEAHTITSIKGKGVSYTFKDEAKQLFSKQTADYMTDMLQAVVETGGTGVKAQINRALAGKTGTTQHGISGYKGNGIRDAWFAGYTPEWTAVVWMGYDTSNATHLLTKGSAQAAALFSKVMSAAMNGMPQSSFSKPEAPVQETPPGAVSGLQAAFSEEEQKVALSWQAVEGDNITYFVYRKELPEDSYRLFVDDLEQTLVDDMSAHSNRTYVYYVTAYDSKTKLESARSNEVTVTVPDMEMYIPEIPMGEEHGEGEIMPTPEPSLPETQPVDPEHPSTTTNPELPNGVVDPGEHTPASPNPGGSDGDTGGNTGGLPFPTEGSGIIDDIPGLELEDLQ